MNNYLITDSYYIGWDVGGWNCDHNQRSRDAIAVLDANLCPVGKPWRGNLRETINNAQSSQELVSNLFALCNANEIKNPERITLAIDIPLGFSEAFVQLVTKLKNVELLEASNTNAYLFRQTELYLFGAGLKPLSPIKDMIGSQATKGMHVLAKFAPNVVSCGVWSDGSGLTAIEAYPSSCKNSKTIEALYQRIGEPPGLHADERDAIICALIAYLFAEQREELIPPDKKIPWSEGWIWVPKDISKNE